MSSGPPEDATPSERDRQVAETLAEHLPPGFTADYVPPEPTPEATGEPAPEAGRAPEDEPAHGQDVTSSLTLQGGDVHRSLFRLAEASASSPQDPNRLLHHRRAATVDGDLGVSGDISGDISGGISVEAPGEDDRSNAADDGGSEMRAEGSVIGRLSTPMPVRDMMAPQGFRREFILQQQLLQQRQREARQQQIDLRQRTAAMQRRRSLLHARRLSSFGAARIPITRNFVEFLELYGHFADEDLETSDEEDEGDDEGDERDEGEVDEGDEEDEQGWEQPQPEAGGEAELERGLAGERRPLLGRRTMSGASRGHVRPRPDDTSADGSKAQAGMAQSFFTLLKAFVGTGIMFLPKAYNNGGMGFSTLTLLVVSALSMAGFRLLLQCRQRFGGSYGDIGQAIAGQRMRALILGSIALSQLGFVCAGIVFVAENLASFASAVQQTLGGRPSASPAGLFVSGSGSDAPGVPSTNAIIALEAAVLIPLAFVRDIARLGPAALLGDVFIGIGLAYMYAFDLHAVAARGWRPHETVQPWFNANGYALTVGAAIFTFEGIGLILPIQSSMARPQRFGSLLALVMAIITVAYIAVGALGYAAFGTATKTEVIDNYPRQSPLVQAVQCLYALAVLAGLPVQLFPAVRIIEGRLFARRSGLGYSGKRSPRIKWIKNALRASLVVLCAGVAIAGAGQLDRFVALIGSLACVPLLFIYPPYLHFRGMTDAANLNDAVARVADIALMAVGTVAMIYTTIVTLAN